MKKIFISYRRSDSYNTERLAQFLKQEFGPENIFFDTKSVEPGDEWPKSIEDSLIESDLLLLVIGLNWLHIHDEESGRRKIDLPSDWVRKEILTFLEKKKANPELLLIPVLVNGTTMLKPEYLDEELAVICDFQSIEIRSTGSSLDFVQLKRMLLQNRFRPLDPPVVVTPRSGKIPNQLDKTKEETFLEKYKEWRILEKEKPGIPGDFMRELYRLYEFESYEDAWRFMSKINEIGILPYNHHPRWQNTYNRVEVWLCTFNIGHKPSKRDLRLARILEETWSQFY